MTLRKFNAQQSLLCTSIYLNYKLVFEIVAAYSRSNIEIFVHWVNLEIKIRNDAATP